MEDELVAFARDEPVIQALLQIPGFGILTATAVFATVADSHAFGYQKSIYEPLCRRTDLPAAVPRNLFRA
jgi:transposase